YPFNTIASSYAMTAQANAAQASSIPPLKAIAADMAVKSAQAVLAHKARDCLAQTILASFPVQPWQQNDAQQAAALDRAKAELRQVILELPLCVPAYLQAADLFERQGRGEDALAVLLLATRRFDTRTSDETNRLRLFARAGKLAVRLDKPATAMAMALSLRANQADNPWARAFLKKNKGSLGSANARNSTGSRAQGH
ncbi:MAG: hypothetical protein L0H75_10405, partial [Nitrosospira sp.]|nr:hypothetical protein [Nitrosospira sp.]